MVVVDRYGAQCQNFSINYLIYGNIILFLATTDKLIFITSHQKLPDFFYAPPAPIREFLISLTA